MARRRILSDPMSRLAVWARRIAFFALVAAMLSIIVVRSGLLEVFPAFATFGGALVFAAIAVLLALAAFVAIWKDGLGGLGYALSAMVIGLGILAYPAWLGYKASTLPAIADITTDPIDPPRFEAITRVRPREANTVVYAGLYAAEQQRMAYPQVEPLNLQATAKDTYDAALAVVNKRKWRVVDAREPLEGRRDGRIEAVARTAIMGFREDVVVRVRQSGDGTRVDMRSASRYGQHDFGTNAERVRALLDDVEDVVGTEQEKKDRQERKLQAQKKAQQPQQTKGQAPAKR